MRTLKLILILVVVMGIFSTIQENVAFIRETFTAFMLFIAVQITVIVLVVKLLYKRKLSH